MEDIKKQKHHMPIPWHNVVDTDADVPAKQATLKEKTTLAGRIGLLFLSVGTDAWRVRQSINVVARSMDIAISADIGLLSLSLTGMDDSDAYSESFALHSTGVNTDKLYALEQYIKNEFEDEAAHCTMEEIHQHLDKLEKMPGNYNALIVGLASAVACCAFTFLLGGGIPEMICAFLGAGVGNFLRKKMLTRHLNLFFCVMCSVAAACCTYVLSMNTAEWLFHLTDEHEAGYICSMLFVIPGFPLITGGIDLSKLDMRSGLERLTYAILIIAVATFTGWATAYLLDFRPDDFVPIVLHPVGHALLRIVASFFGVFGFSLMFNSKPKMAAIAGFVGMFANTLRLEMVDLLDAPAGLATFCGTLLAGILAYFVNKKVGYPRISLTVPSVVIMVPGLYMYRGIYNFGISNMADGLSWTIKAIVMVFALILGLVVARLITDKDFRHCS